ncbi:hypothetical protein TNCV_1428441 [Trichonephila clavipes]|nr:hypothetical protein TNCV_1428441 [Trichonephila clavipes]
MLEKVIENWTSRLDYIRASRGSRMPEIIFKMTKVLYQKELRGWFVADLLYPSLRVRPRLKSADFHVAENRQWPYRMIIRHVKDP